MDASTFTAHRLEQQRAADLVREHALRASHRQRHEAGVDTTPARPRDGWRRVADRVLGRGVGRAPRFGAAAAPASCPPCDPASLALAGPSS